MKMKKAVGVVAMMGLIAVVVYLSLDSTPMLQVSYGTKQPVACASKDTDWKIRPADDPVCVKVAKGTADVEWVK